MTKMLQKAAIKWQEEENQIKSYNERTFSLRRETVKCFFEDKRLPTRKTIFFVRIQQPFSC